MGDRNIDTLDAGVPVLAMHAPCEVVAKLDCYMTKAAVTSADRHMLFSMQARTATPWPSQRSSMKVSKAAVAMPATPAEPTSSLSRRAAEPAGGQRANGGRGQGPGQAGGDEASV